MLKQKWLLKSLIAFLLLVTPVTLITQKLIASPNNIQTQSVSTSQTPKVGQLEVVSELNITPGNVTASRDGRIFASVHGMRRGSAQLIEIQPGQNKAITLRVRFAIALLVQQLKKLDKNLFPMVLVPMPKEITLLPI